MADPVMPDLSEPVEIVAVALAVRDGLLPSRAEGPRLDPWRRTARTAMEAFGAYDLDRAWRAVDALGGTWPTETDPELLAYQKGYSEALDHACTAIEKLGGKDRAAYAAGRAAGGEG